ncbi:MAG: thiol protease/hemagglutinin PrtT [Prolixibacteraceae bacterium]|nr:thiol protease/hemagglutinin PrtT [Prolixibacteraceae bacterium]
MKWFLLSGFLLFAIWQVRAEGVTPERAQKVAASFLTMQSGSLKSVSADELVRVQFNTPAHSRFHTLKSAAAPYDNLVYLFKKGNEGFVLIAGDDLAKPVLGYSLSSVIDETNLPVNFLKWVDGYKNQIRYLREHHQLKSTLVSDSWEMLERGIPLKNTSSAAVSPLLQTKWGQSPYYNEYCPQTSFYSDKAVTGCVATAMAQIMKYHNYPTQGQGIFSYYHTNNTVTYGNLSANFGATTYSWANMPNELSAYSNSEQVDAVATLMLHCGISVAMDYSPSVSGAWVTEEKSVNGTSSETALKEYFGYDESSVKGVQRENLTDNEWISLIKNELLASRPVLFAGLGDGGGHAFVTDGFDGNDFLHINWGWGGLADGYYSTDALNPYDLGTGAGGGSYNWYQRVVVGIKPPAVSADNEMYLYSDISVPEIYQFAEFRIDLRVYNLGSSFYGDLGAVLFDMNGDFVEFIETFSLINSPLENRKLYDVWFDSEGLSVYPGTYYIGIYYRETDNNWVALPEIPDGGVSNFIEVEILSPFNDSEIKLYDSIYVQPRNLVTGQAVSITTAIGNFGYSDYSGEFGAGLFTRQGEVVQSLEVIDDEVLLARNWYEMTFFNEKIEAEPGSYVLGLVHFPNTGADQYVVAPGEYLNPIQVNVIEPLLKPDSFEDNDLVVSPFYFNVNFSNDYCGFYTEGTNFHSEVDEDYYAIELPAGYNYNIEARIHDSYRSELGEFTCDAIWAYSDNGEWTDLLDDVMDEPYVLYGGGTVYFGVIPYFEGQTGTYSLSIEIVREKSTSATGAMLAKGLKVFPNPVINYLMIENEEKIDKYSIFDVMGREIKSLNVGVCKFNIDVSSLPGGIYSLLLHSGSTTRQQKIVVVK